MKAQFAAQSAIALSLFLLSSAVTLAGDASATRTRFTRRGAIERIRRVAASDLDASLPQECFDKWLRAVSGVSPINWRVQVGCGDPQNRTPNDVCVSSSIPVENDLNVGLVFKVGTVSYLEKVPSVVLLYHERRDGSRYEEFDTLHELGNFVREVRTLRR